MPKLNVYLYVILSSMMMRGVVGSSMESDDALGEKLHGPELLVDAFHYLPAPVCESSEELGRHLSDIPTSWNTNSSVEYTFSDKATLTYMLHDPEIRGWADLKLRETILTMIAHESGISPYTLGLSESSGLPENRESSKKLLFSIPESEYTAMQRVGVKFRYMIKSGIPDNLIPLEEFSFTKLTENKRLEAIDNIMVGLIKKVKGLGELGIAHGGIDLSRIFVKMDSNTITKSSQIYLTDYGKANLLDAKSLFRDWLCVVQTFSHLVNRAAIIKSHTVRKEMLEARNSLVRSFSENVSKALSVSFYSKYVSRFIMSLSTIVTRGPRPTKGPRASSQHDR